MEEDNLTRITFRMPRELHARVAEAAQASNRSMNAEIIARLERSLITPDENQAASYRSLLSDISRLLDDREDTLLKELKTFLEQSLKDKSGKA